METRYENLESIKTLLRSKSLTSVDQLRPGQLYLYFGPYPNLDQIIDQITRCDSFFIIGVVKRNAKCVDISFHSKKMGFRVYERMPLNQKLFWYQFDV